MVVPGDYVRLATEKPKTVYAPRTDCEPYCRDLQANQQPEETPLVARFGTEDRTQDISVSVRGANTLKLTFLQIRDMTEFGTLDESTKLFVPPGAVVLGKLQRSTPSATGDKTYYSWDFTYAGQRVLLTAAVEKGNVYLLGGTATLDAWDGVDAVFRRASSSFRVGEPVEAAAAKESAAAAVATGPREELKCKGPLPIFCSVEDAS